jgi:putative heme iron utilization protein
LYGAEEEYVLRALYGKMGEYKSIRFLKQILVYIYREKFNFEVYNKQAAELSADPRISVIPVRVSAKKNNSLPRIFF